MCSPCRNPKRWAVIARLRPIAVAAGLPSPLITRGRNKTLPQARVADPTRFPSLAFFPRRHSAPAGRDRKAVRGKQARHHGRRTAVAK